MTELSEASLEAALIEVCKYMDDTGEKIKLTPTHFIFRPADLEALGLTIDEVIKMFKEKK